METLETRLRVRYAETDQMGVVYYANYLIWMEVGRAELCRARGIRYRDMEIDDDVMLVVAEANCRYLAPARYEDEGAIRARAWGRADSGKSPGPSERQAESGDEPGARGSAIVGAAGETRRDGPGLHRSRGRGDVAEAGRGTAARESPFPR